MFRKLKLNTTLLYCLDKYHCYYVLLRSTMKTLLCSAFLLVTIANNVLDIHAISSLDDETYSTFLELLKGEFNVPLQQRSTKQKSAIVRFWQNRGHLSLQRGNVCFDGKPVLRMSTVSKVVAKAFKETKGSGVRKLYHHLKDVCSGVGERGKVSSASTAIRTISKQSYSKANTS